MTRRERLWIRCGLIAVIGGILLLRVAPELVRQGRRAVAIQRIRNAQVHRAQIELKEIPALEDSAHVLTTRMAELPSRLLAGNTEAAARADLAAQLRARAWRAHARVTRIDADPDSTVAGGMRRLSVVAILEGDIQSVVGILEGFQQEAPLIVPTRMSVLALDPLGGLQRREVLALQFWASAWYLPGGTP